MSEETTNYGIPNTTLDTEPFPPQTGDLLGLVIAGLLRRVRELEESRKLGETPIENIDQLTVILGNWCSDLRDLAQVVVRMGDRLAALESKQAEAAMVLSGTFHAAAQAAKPDFWEEIL
mgnify:CR=1 FL=1